MEYLDAAYKLLYCVNAFQFPFYIYYYIYTVKFVYSLLFHILFEYKKELPSTVLRSWCTEAANSGGVENFLNRRLKEVE